MDPLNVAAGAGGGTALLFFLAKWVFSRVDGGVIEQGKAVHQIQVTVGAIAQELKWLRDQLAELRGELRGDARARADLESTVKVLGAQLAALATRIDGQDNLLREATVRRIAEAQRRGE